MSDDIKQAVDSPAPDAREFPNAAYLAAEFDCDAPPPDFGKFAAAHAGMGAGGLLGGALLGGGLGGPLGRIAGFASYERDRRTERPIEPAELADELEQLAKLVREHGAHAPLAMTYQVVFSAPDTQDAPGWEGIPRTKHVDTVMFAELSRDHARGLQMRLGSMSGPPTGGTIAQVRDFLATCGDPVVRAQLEANLARETQARLQAEAARQHSKVREALEAAANDVAVADSRLKDVQDAAAAAADGTVI